MQKNTPPSKASLPALDRGLSILELLIRAGGGPLRFGEIRASLSGVQDSTLARILKALEGYGYIERDADTGYRLAPQVLGWGAYLSDSRPPLADLARREVDRLAEEGHESACITLLGPDKIEVLCSSSIEGGISILKPGNTLHFESDHAGALVILERLSPEERRRHLLGPFSRFEPGEDFDQCLRAGQRMGAALRDVSRARPGVCRLAQAFRHGDQLGSIFFGLTLEACEHKQAQLSSLLASACERLSRS